MITIFRRIRQKLIDSGSVTKYLLYAAGEILLVVIGILIALQVSNWNEGRNLRSTEIKYLNELKNDIKETIIEIEADIVQNEIGLNSGVIVRDFLISDHSFNDSLIHHFQRISIDAQLYPKSSAFESIKSTGLEILSNDSLRTQITTFYQVTLRDIEDLGRVNQAERSHLYRIGDHVNRHFELDGSETVDTIIGVEFDDIYMNDWKLKNLNRLKSDSDLAMKLQWSMLLRVITIERLEYAKTEAEVILGLIESDFR